jgi:hypothetical protein
LLQLPTFETGTGAGFTCIVTDAGALVPPGPVQVIVRVLAPSLTGTIDCELFTTALAAQVSVQAVAFVVDHVSVVELPSVIVVGFAESVTVGTAAIMVKVGELLLYWELLMTLT